jgi:hypothetical protein
MTATPFNRTILTDLPSQEPWRVWGKKVNGEWSPESPTRVTTFTPQEDGYFTLLPEVDRIDIAEDTQYGHIVVFQKKARKTKPTVVAEITRIEVTALDSLPSKLLVKQYLSLNTTMLSKGICTDLCCVEYLERVEILSEILESEKSFLGEFLDLCHGSYWNHVSLSLSMPIEEIRVALAAQ